MNELELVVLMVSIGAAIGIFTLPYKPSSMESFEYIGLFVVIWPFLILWFIKDGLKSYLLRWIDFIYSARLKQAHEKRHGEHD